MDKFNSRKFILAMIVTIAFIVIEGFAIFYAFIHESWDSAIKMAPFLIYIAGVYVGGNVAQDFSFNKGKTDATKKTK